MGSCQWMKTAGDDCTQSDDNACRCRDYNSVKQRCAGCSVNPCQKRFCFDIVDLPDNSCQWMYNEGDDCTSTDPNAEACRQRNAHSCAPCPRYQWPCLALECRAGILCSLRPWYP